MDTSVKARLVMIAIIFFMACMVVIVNLCNAVLMVFGKKLSRASKIIWPALGLLLVFCVVDTFYIEPDWIQVTQHSINTPKIPQGSKFRIIQLSDLHIEKIGKREERMLYLTALKQPGAIVMTGDYANHDNPQTMRLLTKISKRLSQIAPTYAIEGNWDSSNTLIALKKGGVNLVYNWTVIRNKQDVKIALGQAHWASADIASLPREMRSYYTVLLCHMPRVFDFAAQRGVDLTLVGHTHGGQIRIPIFGALVPDRSLVGKYQAGLYEQGNSLLYVNRGVGMEGSAPEIRFCCRPEVAIIDIMGSN